MSCWSFYFGLISWLISRGKVTEVKFIVELLIWKTKPASWFKFFWLTDQIVVKYERSFVLIWAMLVPKNMLYGNFNHLSRLAFDKIFSWIRYFFVGIVRKFC